MSKKNNSTNQTSSPEAVGFKTRRSHKKSRYGCTKCKQRRIKCDERSPKCSRCEKMNLSCQYPKRKPNPLVPDDFLIEHIDPLLLQYGSQTSYGIGSPRDSDHSSESPLSSVSSFASAQLLAALPRQDRWLDSNLILQAAQTLIPIDFELFKHYLEHTSKDLTVGDEEQHTLQIGIPNLACQSKPLMKSVLAISAVCKCLDIINRQSASREDRGQVIEFLSLANRYHMESLREIQAALPQTKHYDHILANAAMMGMYGSGSHCARIWLAKTAALGDQLQEDLMPRHSQWIKLFRAVHLAYDGLLKNAQSPGETAQFSLDPSPDKPTTRSSPQKRHEYQLSPRVELHRSPINHTLYPIMAATLGTALTNLRRKARDLAVLEARNSISVRENSTMSATHGNPDIEACFVALSILSNIVSETFPTDDLMTSTPLSFEVDVDPVGQLSEVSPWLRRYTASITSMVPSSLPRRFIMAFIHKVPTKYLNLVEEMLSLIQTNTPDSNYQISWTPEPGVAHQLAIDIFAHWLVLVILLDNVWWIGDIGAWELGRIVSFRKMCLWWSKDEDWWPESMFEIKQHFEKYRTRN
ncbi:hypothetical protein TMatcc_002817 [Talaromyces marneffei ATCC 18224]|uniref:uncharacterized protein n=1 Tax=Talaromyces marneffei TaxID=37727 RepID=UPI0012A85867|nr:uncharacterized protein EYB26_002098 [Talaromyces marneffei]KAE8555558.1 hypothetical protein EYB25_000255 [Talaromyces marneffei]QGA14444.1 hypothetical protein EYB26_002098 [Talaromyces marneffei]